MKMMGEGSGGPKKPKAPKRPNMKDFRKAESSVRRGRRKGY